MIGSGRGSKVDQSFMVFAGGLGFGGVCVIGIVAMEACLFCGAELAVKKTLGIAELGFELGPSFLCGRAIIPLLAFFKV